MAIARRLFGRSLVSRLVALAVIVIVWDILAALQPLFVADPLKVLDRVRQWTLDGTLLDHVGITILEILVGGGLAFLVGIVSGLLLSQWRLLDVATRPYIDVMNALPRLGFAPLFVLWFGLGITSKVALVFAAVVFTVLVNTYAGVKSVEQEHVVLARLLGATRRDVVMKVFIPSLVPWLVASLRLGGAHAVSGAVVAEFVAGNRGLGYLLAFRSSILDTVGAFASLLILAALAGVMTAATMAVENRALRWRHAGVQAEGPSRKRRGADGPEGAAATVAAGSTDSVP